MAKPAKPVEANRLPRNFHRSFVPERQYITALLRFAAAGQEGDSQAIAAATGIPTGASTGKVPAILDYCRGMGLVRLTGPDRSAVKRPELTPFGRIVLREDPYLKEPVSQWIAHFNLCSPLTGAEVWFQTFFAGLPALGMTFDRVLLEKHLAVRFGSERSGLIGPLVRTYEDDASLRICGSLAESEKTIRRKAAPVSDELARGYGAWLLSLMRTHFPAQRQVSVTELDAMAGWRSIPGWDLVNLKRVLEAVERKGLIAVDRHMEPWLLVPSQDPDQAWKQIYDDLI